MDAKEALKKLLHFRREARAAGVRTTTKDLLFCWGSDGTMTLLDRTGNAFKSVSVLFSGSAPSSGTRRLQCPQFHKIITALAAMGAQVDFVWEGSALILTGRTLLQKYTIRLPAR